MSASTIRIGEWVWRFLAAAMLFAVCWAIWIISQLNPEPPLVLNPAFEAAAKARANEFRGEKQNAQGVITPSSGAGEVPKAADESPKTADASQKAADAATAAATPPVPEVPKVPPINPEKLKFADTLALPVPNAKK